MSATDTTAHPDPQAITPPTTLPPPDYLTSPKAFSGKIKPKKIVKRILIVCAIVGLFVTGLVTGWWWVSAVLGFFIVCGALDVLRHKPLHYGVIDRYFFGNGVLTWLLAPFNLLMDLISLPYRNKGIYHLEDLPDQQRADINEVLDAARNANLIEQLETKITDGRSMIFFKWYGKDLPVSVDVPAFHKQYATIRTIGVSVFNKRKSTSWHFGPLRATFRVLYNLRPTPDDAAFIQCGDTVHRWNAQPLFIFDDTLMHQSRNETDHARYCMFIDIVRPNKITPVMNQIVAVLQLILIRINRKFYKRWAMIK